MDKTLKLALLSLLFNAVFSVFHIVFGITTYSWWLFTTGLYYALLSLVRFVVLRTKKQNDFATKFSGVMLMVLVLPLVGMVILAVVRDRGFVLHKIVMIAMATFSFTKITLAIINLIKSQKSLSAKLFALRNISLSEACVSLFALQRSMLVSFEGMTEIEIQIMNVATGTAVCVIVFILGLHLAKNKRPQFNI
ncbi:MAG: hypothetical protein IJF72_01390 [Clostridia bacterium]|nr:hypothetical protein [Clostridia bacterium]